MRIAACALLSLALFRPSTAHEAQVAQQKDAPSFRSPDGRAVAQLLLESSQGAYLGRLLLEAGAQAPEHRHEVSEELVYVLSGSGSMTLDGETMVVQAGTAVRIPAGVAHSFTVGASGPMEVVQVYSPAGPEQRFRSWPPQAPQGGTP